MEFKKYVLDVAGKEISFETGKLCGQFSTEEFDREFQKICGRNNISFILLDAETRTIKSFASDYV